MPARDPNYHRRRKCINLSEAGVGLLDKARRVVPGHLHPDGKRLSNTRLVEISLKSFIAQREGVVDEYEQTPVGA